MDLTGEQWIILIILSFLALLIVPIVLFSIFYIKSKNTTEDDEK